MSNKYELLSLANNKFKLPFSKGSKRRKYFIFLAFFIFITFVPFHYYFYVSLTVEPRYNTESTHHPYPHLMTHTTPPYPKQLLDFNATNFGKDFVYAYQENGTLSLELSKSVRIFCYIPTFKEAHETHAVHVRATWVQHCNNFLFLSTVNDTEMPAVDMNVKYGRILLWQKMKKSLKYIYNNYNLSDYDWFLQSNHDTYFIIENLRYMLRNYSPDHLALFGPRLIDNYRTDRSEFVQGGGYVMSRETLKTLVEKGFPDSSKCSEIDAIEEDRQISACLLQLGVTFPDTRDQQKRHRFFASYIGHHIVPVQMVQPDSFWIHNLSVFPIEQGPNCCSDYAISFHYTEPKMMYLFEYFVYHLRAFGIDKNSSNL